MPELPLALLQPKNIGVFSLLQEGTGNRFLTHSQSSAVLGQGLTAGFPAKWAVVSLSFFFLPFLFQDAALPGEEPPPALPC